MISDTVVCNISQVPLIESDRRKKHVCAALANTCIERVSRIGIRESNTRYYPVGACCCDRRGNIVVIYCSCTVYLNLIRFERGERTFSTRLNVKNDLHIYLINFLEYHIVDGINAAVDNTRLRRHAYHRFWLSRRKYKWINKTLTDNAQFPHINKHRCYIMTYHSKSAA